MIRDWLTRRVVAFLSQPVAHYERSSSRFDRLAQHIRKGDVLLIEGDERVSAVIKYLTQSSWSHAALYIGDELLLRGGETRDWALESFGDDARQLVVDALSDGVVASPLAKYEGFNARICRPHVLRPDDLKVVLDEAVDAIGWRYDLRNILDLARHLILASLFPGRRRRAALGFGSGAEASVICTSLLGRLFDQVGFPVLPEVSYPDGVPSDDAARRRFLPLRRRRAGPDGVFRRRHPTRLTPRDFDLSPYFEIVKFNVIESGGFDYHAIRWAEDPDPEDRQP